MPDAGEVRVLMVMLDEPVDVVQHLGRVLSADERNRAERFVFAHDKTRFIVGRAALRLILGQTLGVPARALRFEYGPQGKPALAEPFDSAGVAFNLAHSSQLALVAMTRGTRIGVDIEWRRPLDDLGAIAEQTFSLRERRTLLALPETERVPAFFRCWTRKEAFVKAVGEGLSYPLDTFSVSLRPEEEPRLVEIRGDEMSARRWTIVDLEPAPGYAAAAAVDGQCTNLAWSKWCHESGSSSAAALPSQPHP